MKRSDVLFLLPRLAHFGFRHLINHFSILTRYVLSTMLIMLALVGPAMAHPHIWVDAKTSVVFDSAGKIREIRHHWVFDEAFSAWAVQGLDTNGDHKVDSSELAELTDNYMQGLAEYDYYTFAGEQDTKNSLKFDSGAAQMSYTDSRLTLDFSLYPKEPITVQKAFEIQVSDPEYYVDFSFTLKDGAELVGAPSDCRVDWHPPGELPPDVAKRLYEIPIGQVEIPEDLKAEVRKVANVATVTCNGAEAPTAAQAVTDMSRASGGRAAPFAAPPVEQGFNMPNSGFLGWVYEKQKAFYGVMTGAMHDMRNSPSAFWTLALLSFLYGVFHAAGPGHGKAVVSSYALAGERDLRRGIALSFAASMMQALVAITVVLVLAMILNMTSIAMSNITGMMAEGSYALLMLMGLYLVLRKIFGWGHHHHHKHNHDHAHQYDAQCSCEQDHCHAVLPKDTRTDWRGMLGVVLTVGMRPCSGALVVLVFSLSLGLFGAGIVSVLLMGLGTGITVATLASIAVMAKSTALRFAGSAHSGLVEGVVWWFELGTALLVLSMGAVLFASAYMF